jgi:hypothetical protein
MNGITEDELKSEIRRARKEAYNNLLAILTIVAIVVVLPLIALAYVFHEQRNARIECANLSMSSITYLQSSGEAIPSSCIAGH